MGKYMRRKCGGRAAAPAAVEHRAPVAVALGVRTRSRAAASDDASRRKRKRASTAVEDALLGRDGGGDAAAGCYKQLRSRRLFMPASANAKVEELRGQRADEAEASTARLADSGRSVEVGLVAAEVSRCSSTASTAADVEEDRERSGDDAEACESRDVESSECGGRRERRETTPSSRSPVDSSDPELESSKATDEQKRKRRRCQATAAAFHLDLEARARTPPAAEIEEFFAAAEKAQAVRFAAKYNFDVARGVPLNAGRFEWSPV